MLLEFLGNCNIISAGILMLANTVRHLLSKVRLVSLWSAKYLLCAATFLRDFWSFHTEEGQTLRKCNPLS